MIVVACASELEQRRLRRMIDVDRIEVHGGRPFYFGRMLGRDICLLRTGAGRKNAASGAHRICYLLQPDLVIIAGAAGALDPALGLGEVVVVEAVVRQNNAEEHSCPDEEVRRAIALLNKAGINAVAGRCCQAAAFMHRADDKRALHVKTGASIVDMESAAFAAGFQAAGVPFINIRIVSDTARQDTADMETLVRLRHRRGKTAAALYCAGHPREFLRILLLYRGMAIADTRIAAAVSALMATDEFR